MNKMKKNMGSTDKIIRVILAALIAVLYLTGVLKGALGLILLIVAIIFVVTSLIGFCPLYTLFGFNTGKKGK
jgi:hypothetical protein